MATALSQARHRGPSGWTAVVLPAPGTARHRLRVRPGRRSDRLRSSSWWRPRLVLGSTLVLGLVGALLLVVHALVVLRLDPAQALVRYALGAVGGASAGFLLGLAAAALWTVVQRRRGAAEVVAEPRWVRHRRSA
jgi:hypothetical protein